MVARSVLARYFPQMRLATWNVNSVRTRLRRLVAFLGRHQPDALCLQELKVQDGQFPFAEVRAAGYHAAIFGQKTYNGVAILSKEEPQDVVRGFGDGEDDPQARFIAATVGGVRVFSVYVPNGQEVGSPAYQYKLRWLGRLRTYLDTHHTAGEPIAIGGDYNVAPDDRDVHDPLAWKDQVLCTDAERAAFAHVCAFGLTDSLRHLLGDKPTPFTWWDYRNLGFPKNLGVRIDHFLVSAPLLGRCTEAVVDREERKTNKTDKEDKPSDHAPVLVTLAPGTHRG